MFFIDFWKILYYSTSTNLLQAPRMKGDFGHSNEQKGTSKALLSGNQRSIQLQHLVQNLGPLPMINRHFEEKHTHITT